MKTTIKNKFLVKLLQDKGMVDTDVWRDINGNGSVQHLDFLSQQEKDVFKTYSEL